MRGAYEYVHSIPGGLTSCRQRGSQQASTADTWILAVLRSIRTVGWQGDPAGHPARDPPNRAARRCLPLPQITERNPSHAGRPICGIDPILGFLQHAPPRSRSPDPPPRPFKWRPGAYFNGTGTSGPKAFDREGFLLRHPCPSLDETPSAWDHGRRASAFSGTQVYVPHAGGSWMEAASHGTSPRWTPRWTRFDSRPGTWSVEPGGREADEPPPPNQVNILSQTSGCSQRGVQVTRDAPTCRVMYHLATRRWPSDALVQTGSATFFQMEPATFLGRGPS